MVNIIHRVGIKASISEVYKVLSSVQGIGKWWTQNTSGTSEIGKTIALRFHSQEGNEVGSMQMLVKALVPNKKVHWHFTAGPEEWLGTDVVFNLHEEEGLTIILFEHKNWSEAIEFTAHCSMKWAIFLLSLKELMETGRGRPSPHDIKIDNWN
ncbi:SRPBCC family protein [Galbibacter pacificus]|uniref:SRPBCC domain-containing protein n=1 Tax=Galbibacter pacificus TaxID=2996052 RepID=A0ABT6FV92_9FLAO|nr:SRPBCC domain-containing protein [Galbibacter pacificus]MDG3583891.1 SRPBCC domain-containing protein [Galbibacter pacificus]MDG3587191.1 SRPBCC domain-containing protein [Galbibacter pacificus]